ncbi:bifunctional tetrahydrofolate synthase/dihydrofolate synthase [Uliginosibacterium paludis]|uniref:Dihydrofolate synthase/folylpolyglutamate synthase n=1 Tax=Uliginosibacterium paludis TaxID=1615952 RepID=A0ABV2CL07_9RHOO
MLAVPATLEAWLTYIEAQHSRPIDLGLDRVGRVLSALGLGSPMRVITVGGTNGKGSTCAMLEAILHAAGYRVGLYTSPHLLRYNERVRINLTEASDDALCGAFAAVEAARGEVPLTYFEYATLAAWQLFSGSNLDVAILEVGLGGRLDAVNAIEPDCSIVTGVAMDHMDYLGDTREAIGFEKAGIFRSGKPAVCGDPEPPSSLVAHAMRIGADLRIQGRDYGFTGDKNQWSFVGKDSRRNSLAYPALRGANQLLNASTVLAALECLAEVLPVPMQAVRQGLMTVELPARFQILPGKPAVVLDVAHNPQAAAVLAENLMNMGFFPETWAVCGMLADKDIAGSLVYLAPRVDHWLLCQLPGPRAASPDVLEKALRDAGSSATFEHFETPELAFASARSRAGDGDRIVAFGSFLTVAGAMRANAARR